VFEFEMGGTGFQPVKSGILPEFARARRRECLQVLSVNMSQKLTILYNLSFWGFVLSLPALKRRAIVGVSRWDKANALRSSHESINP
jgi:hypothetical protein